MDSVLAVIAVITVAGTGWYWSLRLYPYRPCGSCRGSGRNPGSTSRRFGGCRDCGGSGRKLRFGAAAVERRRSR
jgi:DnaJ-class molecular chaperone